MEISDKDKALVDSLVNPDRPAAGHFRHDFQVSQKILGLLICDRHFLIQSLDLLKSEYFEDRGHQAIAKIVINFFKEYKELPNKVYIESEIKEKTPNPELMYQYLGELEAVVMGYVPGVESKEYLMDKIVEFAKEQSVKLAVAKTVDLVKKKPASVWSDIWDVWRQTMTVDKSHDLGLDYFNELDARYERMLETQTKKEIFTSGFPQECAPPGSRGIDGMLTAGGLCRGEIGCYVGLSGAGKSIALIGAAAKNLEYGKRVCYITLEMSQDKIAKRFDSLLSKQPFALLNDNKDMVIRAIKDQIKGEEDTRRLVIKHYPGGTADTNTFRAYLSQLNLFGFKPDLLVVDYVGELRDIPGIKTYESRQLLVRDLRTIAQEEQICVLTAIQANRQGREAQDLEGQIDDDAMADSFGQARPMDAIWSLNKPESGANVGKLFVVKHRDGISRQEIYYRMSTDTLLMSEISKEDFQSSLSEYRKKKANKVNINTMEVNNGNS